MSESDKKPRSLQEIQNEYQSLCLKAGHTQYQIFALEKELNVINERLRDVNFEAASLQAKEKSEEAKPEDKGENK